MKDKLYKLGDIVLWKEGLLLLTLETKVCPYSNNPIFDDGIWIKAFPLNTKAKNSEEDFTQSTVYYYHDIVIK